MKPRVYLALFCLLVPVAARAETGLRRDEGERLIKQSSQIFVGQVVGQRSEKTKDGRMILTRYTLRVDRMIKGDPTSLIEITEYGGVVGAEAMSVSHSANYAEGRSYLVFVNRDDLGQLRTMGGMYGQLPVTPGQGGKSMVRMYPGHPLLSLLPRRTIWDLDELVGTLNHMALGKATPQR